MAIQIVKPKLLLGEGQEEVRFFGELLKHLKIEDVQVEQYGGKTNLAPYLRAPQPGFNQLLSMGVTRDADTDSRAAFQSAANALSAAGFASPQVSGQFVGAQPKAGVFILPDGARSGMLEDLCLASVQNSPEMRCVDDYFKCILDSTARDLRHVAKARTHAWLSAQERPDRRLGEAAEAGYWQWDHPAFNSLKDFLRAL